MDPTTNYCGVYYSDGKFQPSVDGTVPAVNDLDEACKQHDKQYYRHSDSPSKLNEADEIFYQVTKKIGGVRAPLYGYIVKHGNALRRRDYNSKPTSFRGANKNNSDARPASVPSPKTTPKGSIKTKSTNLRGNTQLKSRSTAGLPTGTCPAPVENPRGPGKLRGSHQTAPPKRSDPAQLTNTRLVKSKRLNPILDKPRRAEQRARVLPMPIGPPKPTPGRTQPPPGRKRKLKLELDTHFLKAATSVQINKPRGTIRYTVGGSRYLILRDQTPSLYAMAIAILEAQDISPSIKNKPTKHGPHEDLNKKTRIKSVNRSSRNRQLH